MKTRLLIVIVISIVVIALMPFLLFQTTIFHFEPTINLEEFQEKFDNENIVKHFKSKYPEYFVGWGKSGGMISPTWGYGSVNDRLIAELRIEESFEKYEFTYTCGDIGNDWNSDVMIKNPTKEDIDNNHCW